jgi:amino acid permease
MESVKAGSPTMLIAWCITSIIVYFLVVRGEKLE